VTDPDPRPDRVGLATGAAEGPVASALRQFRLAPARGDGNRLSVGYRYTGAPLSSPLLLLTREVPAAALYRCG